MPGKHAPASPTSFYRSLARSFGAYTAVALVLIVVAVMVFRGGDDREPSAARTPTRSATPSPTPSPNDTLVIESETPSPTPTETGNPTPEPSGTTLAPSQITVQVLNGTRRGGLARRIAAKMESAGYQIAGVGNARPAEKSVIVYQPGARDEAEVLQQQFPDLKELREGNPRAVLQVIIGADYPESSPSPSPSG